MLICANTVQVFYYYSGGGGGMYRRYTQSLAQLIEADRLGWFTIETTDIQYLDFAQPQGSEGS